MTSRRQSLTAVKYDLLAGLSMSSGLSGDPWRAASPGSGDEFQSGLRAVRSLTMDLKQEEDGGNTGPLSTNLRSDTEWRKGSGREWIELDYQPKPNWQDHTIPAQTWVEFRIFRDSRKMGCAVN